MIRDQSKSRPVKAAGAESCDQGGNQKLHTTVARSAFGSENVKKLMVSEHFLKLRCRRREPHLEVKMLKPDGLGALFEVAMSKNWTPLWREACLEVKMHKTPGPGSTF